MDAYGYIKSNTIFQWKALTVSTVGGSNLPLAGALLVSFSNSAMARGSSCRSDFKCSSKSTAGPPAAPERNAFIKSSSLYEHMQQKKVACSKPSRKDLYPGRDGWTIKTWPIFCNHYIQYRLRMMVSWLLRLAYCTFSSNKQWMSRIGTHIWAGSSLSTFWLCWFRFLCLFGYWFRGKSLEIR